MKTLVDIECPYCKTPFRVRLNYWLSQHTKSCGCMSAIWQKYSNFKHGYYKSSTYRSWSNMWTRVTNTNHVAYNHYGGRGIVICKQWKQFKKFLEDMGFRPLGMTLDRIDVNGNYEPSNCRWATASQQQLNKRRPK